jgi:hypothetical protein
MSDDLNPEDIPANSDEKLHNIISLDGLYENWFLDYASYVILDRAVPHINDGLNRYSAAYCTHSKRWTTGASIKPPMLLVTP